MSKYSENRWSKEAIARYTLAAATYGVKVSDRHLDKISATDVAQIKDRVPTSWTQIDKSFLQANILSTCGIIDVTDSWPTTQDSPTAIDPRIKADKYVPDILEGVEIKNKIVGRKIDSLRAEAAKDKEARIKAAVPYKADGVPSATPKKPFPTSPLSSPRRNDYTRV